MAKQVLVDLDFNNVASATNLRAPAAANDAVRLTDLQSAIEGLAWKDDVRAGSTANINLASPGAAVGAVTMNMNDPFLAKDQTAPAENGLYIWNGPTTPATRHPSASTAAELTGAVVTVTEGTNAGTTWRQSSVAFTLNTDPVAWGPFNTGAAPASETTAGIAEVATQVETDAGTDDGRFVTPAKLANWSGRIRKFAGAVGDGSSTSITITHNFNTRDVAVALYRNSGSYDEVIPDIQHTTVNSVTLVFVAAPASSAFRAVVTG